MHIDTEQFKGVLKHAKEMLAHIQDGTAVLGSGTAFGDPERDIELMADRVVGRRLAEVLGYLPQVARVSVEGLPHDLMARSEGLWVTVDPIDGSLNYKCRGEAFGFPYVCCMTAFSRFDGATFDDIVMAGVIDLRPASHDVWIVERDAETGRCVTTLNDEPIVVPPASRLDIGSQIVIGEFYYPEHRETLVRAFAGKKGWLRNPGSAAYEMASVASGQAIAFLCDRQKQHELGAGVALVKGAGGVAVDWDGNDLAGRPYDFRTPTPAILAASRGIADDLLSLLRR